MMTQGERLVYVQIFLFLQVLDLLTTLVGFKYGAGEASPFVRWLMQHGAVAGLAACKLLALALAGLCVWMKKLYLIRWISYWYAGLIVWNLSVILCARP